ncbi:MAG: hypothetical protein WBO54_12180, partial [Thermoanaerobaculia bacterium]
REKAGRFRIRDAVAYYESIARIGSEVLSTPILFARGAGLRASGWTTDLDRYREIGLVVVAGPIASPAWKTVLFWSRGK